MLSRLMQMFRELFKSREPQPQPLLLKAEEQREQQPPQRPS